MNSSLSLGQIIEIVLLIIAAIVIFRFRVGIKKFVLEALSELKKVTWTTRKDLLDSTWVVLFSSAILGLFIGVADFILARFVSVLMK